MFSSNSLFRVVSAVEPKLSRAGELDETCPLIPMQCQNQ